MCWDIDALFAEILTGMRKCAEMGTIPETVGICTWGVDFVLVDFVGGNKDGIDSVSSGDDDYDGNENSYHRIIGEAVAYRDPRTNGICDEVARLISDEELYSRTGIQKLNFNTIYQLMAVKMAKKENGGFEHILTKPLPCGDRPSDQLTKQAGGGFGSNFSENSPNQLSETKLLLLPDYFHYKLCGVAKTEYTNATTTGLVNAFTRQWDDEIIARCGFPRDIFCEIVPPGTFLGELLPEIREKVGYNCRIIVPATHDTASAVAALSPVIPSTISPTTSSTVLSSTHERQEATFHSYKSGHNIFISSGTWSLMGVERAAPDCSEAARVANFTNEGGCGGRIRFLKNIMGLWPLQCVKKELGDEFSFAQLAEMAAQAEISSIIDINDPRLFAPKSMMAEIKTLCAETSQQIPQTAGELAAVIYHSLAKSYAQTAAQIEEITGEQFEKICIIGGGVRAEFLNALTAEYCKKPVVVGHAEATAVGNLLVQMQA